MLASNLICNLCSSKKLSIVPHSSLFICKSCLLLYLTPSSIPSSSNSLLNPSKHQYIFMPIIYSRILDFYDISSQSLSSIKLDLPGFFSSKKVISLPSNTLLLTIFSEYQSLYLYNLSSRSCIKLSNLPSSRYNISFYYYASYIYAFGGMQNYSKVCTAERYSLITNRWERLNNMKYSASNLSPVGIDSNIYLFNGSASSIEVFNVHRLKFREIRIENSEETECCGFACLVRNMIFLITCNYIQVFDKDIKKLQTIRNPYPSRLYSSYNIVSYSDTIYFHNDFLGYIKLDTSIFPLSLPSIDQHSSNLNRYIYLPELDSKQILRFDLELNSFASLSLSRALAITGICLLPSDEVFLATVNESNYYILDPASFNLTSIPAIPTSRHNLSLVYYNSAVYCFGGGYPELRNAERFLLNTNKWERLEDMIERRSRATSVAYNNMIFIIGGRVKTIEIYHIAENRYEMTDFKLRYYYAVAIVRDESLYIVNNEYWWIVSEELDILREGKNESYGEYTHSRGNVVYWKERISYFNDFTASVEYIQIENMDRGIECFNVI